MMTMRRSSTKWLDGVLAKIPGEELVTSCMIIANGYARDVTKGRLRRQRRRCRQYLAKIRPRLEMDVETMAPDKGRVGQVRRKMGRMGEAAEGFTPI